jgi:hypothetical protein
MRIDPGDRPLAARTMRWLAHAAVALAICAATPLTAEADDSLRCGSRLARVGDGKDKVRALCGEPTSISFAGVVSRPGYYDGPYDYWYFPPSWVELPVEIWTYNLGPTRLLRKLRFVGDELEQITTDGRGY